MKCLGWLGLASAGVCWGAPTVESCRDLSKHGKAEAVDCFTALSRSNDAYVRAEGLWGLKDYQGANEAFRAAAAEPGSKALERVRWGMLLHERFNDPEAEGLFQEALKLDPANARAYLGMAIVDADQFGSKAQEDAAKALALDPKLVEAHEVMANMLLENTKNKGAVEEADKALALSNEATEAMAVRAAVDVLEDRNAEAAGWLAKIGAVNPHDGDGYALVGYHLVLNRRYDEGVAYYRKAIEVDPANWAARSQLGINLMRLGQEDEPRKQLEMSYDNGYKDAATVNSLRLLDSYKNFVTIKDGDAILRLDKKEADLLKPYMLPELHKAIATYDKKYRMTLPGPVQLEVYPNHEDFAVRTMGMPGLGALGVTFGEVVAMDSPSGRKPGDFNWGSTMWHELSHVFILQATKHRVPRWFTEGLAVHEEGQVHPEWGDRLTPEVLVAMRDHKLLPVTQMDQGFIFPEYPTQVIVSYFQAGAICDYIQQTWGDAKLLEMVHSFAQLKTTPEVIEEDLKMSPKDFDQAFMGWVYKKAGDRALKLDDWRTGLRALAATKDNDVVVKTSPGLIAMYPEYVGDANAYEMLAKAELAKGDKAGAVATLKSYQAMGGEEPGTLEELASLEVEVGDKAGAARTLDGVNYIYPEDEGLHRRLGELWLEEGNSAGAVREFGAVVALKPLDAAGANYDLARAYFAAGDKGKAEDSVLAALEVAPGYRPAQKLLVEIKSGSAKGSGGVVTDQK
jgi:tetratricopeptide (TPR) repeat protein